MKIIIGYDGSECADAAIRDLRLAGIPDGAEARVIAVADLIVAAPYAGSDVAVSGVPAPSPAAIEEARGLAAEALENAEGLAHAGAALVRSACPGWTVGAEAVVGSPYWELVRAAESWRADLVVVGSHGRSQLGRLILGSVSQHVLNNAPCAVRIGRCNDSTPGKTLPTRPPRILLAVDGSTDSATAVEAVYSRRWPTGSEALVVTSVDVKLRAAMVWFGRSASIGEASQDAATVARRRVDAVAETLRDRGLSATAIVCQGDPKQSILDEAKRFGADCIFLGAKGHSRLERFLLGSVSSAVASRASCSVEVMRGGV